MELRNLNTFLRVAALQNFTRASQELGYSQSNVSAQIKQPEQELSHPLFDRIGRNVFLTSYGEGLLPYARQAVSTILQMENFMKSEAAPVGTLRIGITDSLSELQLNDALLRFHRRFPMMKPECNRSQYVQLVLHRSKAVTPQIQGFLEKLREILAEKLEFTADLAKSEKRTKNHESIVYS